MPDREKVINELNTDVLPFLQHHCDMQCDREKRWISKMIITVHDALTLLKEQESVEPKKIKGYNPPMYTLYEYKCEKCESLIMNKQPFCMGCGKPVNWE